MTRVKDTTSTHRRNDSCGLVVLHHLTRYWFWKTVESYFFELL